MIVSPDTKHNLLRNRHHIFNGPVHHLVPGLEMKPGLGLVLLSPTLRGSHSTGDTNENYH